MHFALRSRSSRPQELLVDVSVHFVKARGSGARVFKVGRLTLAPRATAELRTSFSLAVHTTRVPRPGRHAVDVLVNGRTHPAGSFLVSRRASRSRLAENRVHERSVGIGSWSVPRAGLDFEARQ